MIHTEASIVINRPIDEVFRLQTDLGRYKDWQDGLVEAAWTSPGPAGVGSTYKFITANAGMRFELPGEIIEWDPPRGWKWKARSGPITIEGGYRFEPTGQGTKLTMFSDSELKGMMKLMPAWLYKYLGERSQKRSLNQLKSLIESGNQHIQEAST